jgi:hypothetical protein
MNITKEGIELYWEDLTTDSQKKILDVFGENCNWDVFPITTIPVEDDDSDGAKADIDNQNLITDFNKPLQLANIYDVTCLVSLTDDKIKYYPNAYIYNIRHDINGGCIVDEITDYDSCGNIISRFPIPYINKLKDNDDIGIHFIDKKISINEYFDMDLKTLKGYNLFSIILKMVEKNKKSKKFMIDYLSDAWVFNHLDYMIDEEVLEIIKENKIKLLSSVNNIIDLKKQNKSKVKKIYDIIE